MTGFILGCAAMLLAALVWLAVPLWRAHGEDVAESASRRRIVSIGTSVFVAVLAVGLYAHLSDWDWSAAEEANTQAATVDSMLQQLEAKLEANPNDLQGWLLLGRSTAQLQRFDASAQAYQRAYDLSAGEDLEATIGLGEALALLDQNSLAGRAGDLFERALTRAPDHPKVLWYASVAALMKGDLRAARDRLQALLAQNPPEQLQAMLERQIQDLNQQLGEQGEGAQPAQAAASTKERIIRVAVTLAPALAQQLKGETPLFVVARDPAAPGPPLAVKRQSTADLPLDVELSPSDAMLPTRSLATASRVKVVARISLTGAPQERAGDFFGEADYDFSKDSGPVRIVIDRIVP
jgi:cytochrome c-type biogenesis protein CcmH